MDNFRKITCWPAADFALNAARGRWKSAVINWVMTQNRTLGGPTEARAKAVTDLLLANGATPTLLKAGKGYALSKRAQSILRRLGMGVTRSRTIVSTAEMRLGQIDLT